MMTDGAVPFYWNPGAISYLVELLLALMLAVYFVKRLSDERRNAGIFAPTFLLGITIWFLVPGLFVSLLHALAGGGWSSYVMPWVSPRSAFALAMPWVTVFTSIAAIAFVQFGYRFPRELPGSGRESGMVGAVMCALVLVELIVALRTDIGMWGNRAWYRPDWFAGWTNISMIWAGILFLRQLVLAQGTLAMQPNSCAATRIVAALKSLFARARNREATAARGLIIFALLPIIHTTALVIQSGGVLAEYPIDFLISWSVLGVLTGLTLVYFGYLPERSSFLFKLTTISVLLLLATVNGTCWIISPTYFEQFRAPDMVAAGQARRFLPIGGRRYTVTAIPLSPESPAGIQIGAGGAPVALPFSLPFYDRTYRTVHVAGDGTIGFDQDPQPSDVAFGYGPHPAIYPLLIARDASERGNPHQTRISARALADRVIVTRQDHCIQPGPGPCLAVQAILHADGRIDLLYLAVPQDPRFQLFDPMEAPWLTGITPGSDRVADPALRPLIRDYYRDFLIHLNQLYAPIVAFVIWAMLAILLGIPLLFRGFLVRPLERLLRGLKRFRDGDLSMQVTPTFNDEIGYLTESFNEMANAQQELINTLEQRVALRTEQVADFAARNARLEERDRLSGDLHDTVSQTLFSAALLSDVLPEQWARDPEEGAATLARLGQLNRHALTEMRLLLTAMRTSGIAEKPVATLIDILARAFAAEHPELTVHSEINGQVLLPAEVQATLYRAAQECLNNIVKHARASHVHITFEGLPGQALLSIRDNGAGFDSAAIGPGHLGLSIMRERAQRVGASLEIESALGEGSLVTLIWMHGQSD